MGRYGTWVAAALMLVLGVVMVYALAGALWSVQADLTLATTPDRALVPRPEDLRAVLTLSSLRQRMGEPVPDERPEVYKVHKPDGTEVIWYYRKRRHKSRGRIGTGTLVALAPDEARASRRLEALEAAMRQGMFVDERVIGTSNLSFEELPGLLTWGRAGACYLVLLRDEPAGNWCILRKGTKVLAYLQQGAVLRRPGELDTLLATQLAAIDALPSVGDQAPPARP